MDILREVKNSALRLLLGELDSSYYDQNLARMIKPLHESPWYENYKLAASYLPPVEEKPKILDLGCGTGHFGTLIASMGYQNYLGLDFSEKRIQFAKENNPDLEFKQANIFSEESKKLFEGCDIIVALECFEHIQNDLKLVRAFPSGKRLIFSVPSYYSSHPRAHLRRFTSFRDVLNRYDKHLDFIAFNKIDRARKGRYIFLSLAQIK